MAKDLSQSGKNYESLLTLSNQLSMTKFIRQHLSDKENQLLPSNTGIPSSGLEAMIMTYNQLMLERNEYLSNTEEGSHIVQVIDRKLAAQKTAIVRSLDNLIVQIQQQINNIQKSEEEINTQIAQNPLKVRELQSVERQQKVKDHSASNRKRSGYFSQEKHDFTDVLCHWACNTRGYPLLKGSNEL